MPGVIEVTLPLPPPPVADIVNPPVVTLLNVMLLPFVITTLSVEESFPSNVSFTSLTFSVELSRVYVVLSF